MNIALICIDCLRGDFLRDLDSDTPFLDRFEHRSIAYTDMYGTATTTTPCVASFMTGRYSEQNGVITLRNVELGEDLSTLAERFQTAGYHTSAYVTGPLVAETDLDRGFDTYNHRGKDVDLFSEWEDVIGTAVEELESPFFTYIHLWELHEPVEVPARFDYSEYGSTPYERALSALDQKLRQLIDQLPEDTVVALHGDHGESISWVTSSLHGRRDLVQKGLKVTRDKLRFERGLDTRRIEGVLNRVFDRIQRRNIRDHYIERGHGQTTYDFMSNVPFIISVPEESGSTIDAQCRQIDIYPTLLELADIDYDESIDGEPLVPVEEIEERDAYIRACGESLGSEKNWSRAIRSDGYKLITYPNRDWPPELYGLQNDPNELNPIDDASLREELKHKLPRHKVHDRNTMEIDGLLEDLGYL